MKLFLQQLQLSSNSICFLVYCKIEERRSWFSKRRRTLYMPRTATTFLLISVLFRTFYNTCLSLLCPLAYLSSALRTWSTDGDETPGDLSRGTAAAQDEGDASGKHGRQSARWAHTQDNGCAKSTATFEHGPRWAAQRAMAWSGWLGAVRLVQRQSQNSSAIMLIRLEISRGAAMEVRSSWSIQGHISVGISMSI